jgi:hypothetical protein
MSCENVRELISLLLDRKLSAGERESVLEHIETCRKCASRLESMQNLRAALRRLNQPPMPVDLTAQLRVLASHERTRQLARMTLAARWQEFSSTLHLWFDNLMRPLAVPAAGGLLSAMVLFSLLVPSLSFSHNFSDQAFLTYPDGEVIALSSNGTYVPASYGEILTIMPANMDSSDYANVVWLTVNENGKVVDYSIERGNLTPDLQSIILFSQFTPATVLGLPTSGRVRVAQRSPEHEVPRQHSIRS